MSSKRIRLKDVVLIDAEPEDLFRTLTDYSTFSRWAPSSMTYRPVRIIPDRVGSRMEIRFPFVGSVFAEIQSVTPNTRIVVRYYDGLYTGAGVWTIHRHDRKTEVGFELDVHFHHPLVRILTFLINPRMFHTRFMIELFRNLEFSLKQSRGILAGEEVKVGGERRALNQIPNRPSNRQTTSKFRKERSP